jgi:hypothetical protein
MNNSTARNQRRKGTVAVEAGSYRGKKKKEYKQEQKESRASRRWEGDHARIPYIHP